MAGGDDNRVCVTKPRQVVIVPALPRNATGKILKTTLREMARGQAEET